MWRDAGNRSQRARVLDNVELGPKRRQFALGVFILSAMACQAPVPAFEGEEIRLPERDLRQVDAGPEASVQENETAPPPPKNGEADGGGNVDPCSAAQLLACFTFEDSINDAKGKLVPAEVTGVAFIAGKTGKAARLGTGQGSRVRFPASNVLATPTMTIETW